MNAVLALCTFCEMHGPKVIFSTQTYRNQSIEKSKFYGPKEIFRQQTKHKTTHDCVGCSSLNSLKYLSNEHESRTSFLSTQQPLIQNINNLLKYACIRSLSCELHPRKEGVCYFGDDYRGHVLSYTFSLKDTQARGFCRWYSFIVFMRDKQFLLNMWPFLIDNVKKIIRELQHSAETKYNSEEAECSQRVIRLVSVNNGIDTQSTSNKHIRALCEITNDKHVFVRIHMWFVWILSTGARLFIEIFPLSLLDGDLNLNVESLDEYFILNNPTSSINLKAHRRIPEFNEVANKCPSTILRELKQALGKYQFRQISYAVLIGIQIVIRGPHLLTLETLYGLSSLVPRACQRVKTQIHEYLDSKMYNFLSVDTSVGVPLPCKEVCRMDIISTEHRSRDIRSHIVKWAGVLPSKLPTFLIKVEKSLENEILVDSVLKGHIKALQEEWENIAKVIHAMHGRGYRGDLSGLMLSLGAGPQDKKLLDSWSLGLPSNPA